MSGIDRSSRIGNLIQKALGNILNRNSDLLESFGVSVTFVRTSKDLSVAKVYITVINDSELVRKNVLFKLNENSFYLRHLLAKTINLRKTPKLHFLYDESVIRGSKMTELIDKVTKKNTQENE